MSIIEIKNISSETLFFKQLSIPDTQIQPGFSAFPSDFNTFREIQEDEELLQYIAEGKVVINNGLRDLTEVESNNIFDSTNVYGSHFCVESSSDITTLESPFWTTKVAMTTQIIPAGEYRIGWQYNWNHGTTLDVFEVRVTSDTVTIHDDPSGVSFRAEGTDNHAVVSDINKNSGFSYKHYEIDSSHEIELQIRSNAGTAATCWNAALEFWRVR